MTVVIAICLTAIAIAAIFAWALVRVFYLASVERENLASDHAQQVEHLCNRIQLPDRTAHTSISNAAPDRDPAVSPEIEFENGLKLVE